MARTFANIIHDIFINQCFDSNDVVNDPIFLYSSYSSKISIIYMSSFNLIAFGVLMATNFNRLKFWSYSSQMTLKQSLLQSLLSIQKISPINLDYNNPSKSHSCFFMFKLLILIIKNRLSHLHFSGLINVQESFPKWLGKTYNHCLMYNFDLLK